MPQSNKAHVWQLLSERSRICSLQQEMTLQMRSSNTAMTHSPCSPWLGKAQHCNEDPTKLEINTEINLKKKRKHVYTTECVSAKSLQSCPILCDPMDYSLTG